LLVARRRRTLLVLVAVLLGVVGLTVVTLRGGGSEAKVEAAPVPTTAPPTTLATTTTTAVPTPPFEAAHAVTSNVALYDSPGAPEPTTTLPNPTIERVPLAFLVKAHGPKGWLQVQINTRPNEATAWIHDADVSLQPIENRILVSVGAKQLTVFKGLSDQILFQAPVATGIERTPTPLGSFYIDVVVDLDYKGGAYGPYQLSVAGFSDVLQSFGGGPGQIAIHGTNHPELIGQSVSNGCIRMTNDDVTALVPFAPVGTPVQVIA
jgi:lipoprotein-anchoring transpeptidase ErfK/SrfK